MPEANYTLKLTLRQANIVRASLEKHFASLTAETDRNDMTEKGQKLRDEYLDTQRLLQIL